MLEESRKHILSLSVHRPFFRMRYRKDALRSLIVSQQMLGTREIALFHHTKCGMSTCTSHGVRQKAKETLPNADCVDEVEFLEFNDLEGSVKSDVEWLKEHPLILPETVITGWVYEVETGQVGHSSIPAARKMLMHPSDPQNSMTCKSHLFGRSNRVPVTIPGQSS
jgi:hypothetical protein